MLIQRLFKRLQTVKDDSVDQALAAALPTAEPGRRREIALMLLGRRRSHASGLIIHYNLLPADIQRAVAADLPHLGPALRAAGRVRDGRGCESVVRLIREARAVGFADIVAEQLRAPSIPTRELAAQTLLELTEHANLHAAESRDLAHLHEAVEAAVIAFRHHHQLAVLLAMAALLPRRCVKAMAVVRDPKQPVLAAFRQLIQDAKEPVILRQLLTWLPMPELAPAVLAALRRARQAARLGTVLTGGHHLLTGPVRQALARAAQPEHLVPTEDELLLMSAAGQRHVPAWVAALPLTRPVMAQALGLVGIMGETVARLSALRHLIAMSGRAADESGVSTGAPMAGATAHAPAAADAVCLAIAPLCSDPEEGIARVALRQLLFLRWAGLPKLLLQLTGDCPHASIREMAASHLSPTGFLWLWNNWPKLPPPRRLAAARALIKLNDHLHVQLGHRLTHADRNVRARAADMIAQLNQGAFFETPLIAMARGDDHKLAASAVKALASARSQDATDALEASLAHGDTRVRANAIEALGRLRARHVIVRLREIAGSDENRPRANAIAELLRACDKQSAPLLATMLADARSRHRISALWLVERADRIDAAGDVAEMALSDPDEAVRRRASDTLRRLLDRMQRPLKIESSAPQHSAGHGKAGDASPVAEPRSTELEHAGASR